MDSRNHLFPLARLLALALLLGALPALSSKLTAQNQPGQNVHQQIVDRALGYRGSPYVYSGTTAAGFDCTGLSYRVYQDVTGLQIARSTLYQAREGRPVERSQLQAGDLVFFITVGSNISHVGIYDGNGGVIHAASAGPRLGVIVSQLSEPYYSTRYATARRILPDLVSSPVAAVNNTSPGPDNTATSPAPVAEPEAKVYYSYP